MSALDPTVYARPAYLPTGPRGDYRPEHRPYRRDEERERIEHSLANAAEAARRNARNDLALCSAAPQANLPKAEAAPQPLAREPLEKRSYRQGRPIDRIRTALRDGIEDVRLLIQAVHEQSSVVRSLLTRMVQADALEILERGPRGQLQRVRPKSADAPTSDSVIPPATLTSIREKE